MIRRVLRPVPESSVPDVHIDVHGLIRLLSIASAVELDVKVRLVTTSALSDR